MMGLSMNRSGRVLAALLMLVSIGGGWTGQTR
jgi:hypothetical protein